jgi:phospholipid/cholesterol/gamma-HCH transport system substrate-binding protein
MAKNFVETITGAVVLGTAIVFIVFAYSKAGLQPIDGYQVISKFDRIDGLVEGSEVRMSGIKIGKITSQVLDPETYLAVVTIDVKSEVKLPTDSSIRVASDGLLGDKYLSITPGADDEMLKPGGEIEHTQGAVDLLSLVGKMMFSPPAQAEGAKPTGNNLPAMK